MVDKAVVAPVCVSSVESHVAHCAVDGVTRANTNESDQRETQVLAPLPTSKYVYTISRYKFSQARHVSCQALRIGSFRASLGRAERGG